MKVLVAGSSGFIGTALTKYLIDLGYEVVGIGHQSSAPYPNLKKRGFTFIKHDINLPIDVKVDAIINLASPTIPDRYKEKPVETIITNSIGILNLLTMCRDQDIPMLQISSVRVLEEVGLDSPHACYIEGKRIAEILCREYVNTFTCQVGVLRFSNVYGPGMSWTDTRVIPTFIKKALADEDIEIFNGGSQVDSFLYITDATQILADKMVSDWENPITAYNSDGITIRDLAETIVRLSKSKSKLIFKKNGFDGSLNRLNLINDEIVVLPNPVGIEEGLSHTIAHYRLLKQGIRV